MKTRFIITAILAFLSFVSIGQHINYDHNPAAGKFIKVNGVNLYYEEYGSGMPLLLLHGNGGDMSAFSNQIPFFAKKYRVIAVDSRLQGRSGGTADSLSYDMMATDFCMLLGSLKIDSAYILGWSDGGINGIIMALKCPQLVKGLAFTGANVVPDSTALPADMITELENLVYKNSKASPKEIALNKMMLTQPDIPYADLAGIKCPVLVMAGDHDIIKTAHTVKIFQSIPNAQMCIFPDSHHGVCQQHPALFNKTVADFFASLAAKK